MRKMRLKYYEPGEIVVAEGEPGESLYIITTGRVRAYVRTGSGSMAEVRQLGEGEFFGEISVLAGGRRTATITAADTCELLEFDKASLDAIARTHPNVREVMQKSYEQRTGNTVEAALRAQS
jgi:CRP-like cAMP-binding protein